MKNPSLTIVIPVHNRADIVEATLRSVEAQTLRPLRLILVDNASNDDTPAVLSQWKRLHQTPSFRIDILTEPTPGAAAARNRGLAEVTSEYIMFFDSDDTMAPSHAERAVKAFNSRTQPDIVGWDCREVALDGSVKKARFASSAHIWHTIMHGSMATQRYAARTELVRRAGGWNPAILGWNDIELGIRLLALHPRIMRLNGPPTVTVRHTRASITGTSFSQGAGRWEASLDAIEASLNTKRLRRWVNLRRAHLAGLYAAEGQQQLADELADAIATSEPCPFYRAIFRTATAITAHHIRGALTILRPFF